MAYPVLIALYTVSAADSAGTFHSPNPTNGIDLPDASFTVFVDAIFWMTSIVLAGRDRTESERVSK